MRAVVDASVAARWYFPEEGRASAISLLSECIGGRLELLAPDLIESEFASLLWTKARRGDCSDAIVAEILSFWEEDRPTPIDSSLLVHRALDLALRLDHPVRDCLYVAAAIEYEAALATADTCLLGVARGLVAQLMPISG